jgi:hypothetical protein
LAATAADAVAVPRLFFRVAALIAVPVFAGPATATAQAPCTAVAFLETINNRVEIVRASANPRRAMLREPVCDGDVIQVGDNSRAIVVIRPSNTPIAINQNTEFVIRTPKTTAVPTVIDLLRGMLLYLSRVPIDLEIRTAFVNASIEGTEFLISAESAETRISVFEGAVRAANDFGTLVVGAGEQAVARQGQPPQRSLVARPRDAVQWALDYRSLD